MELSAEFFEQTITAMKGYGASGRQSKRVQPRVGIRCRIKLTPVGPGAEPAPLEAWTRDISRSGVGLVSSQRVKPGSRYSLLLPRSDEKPPLQLFCTVKNCSELAAGIFAVGVVFDVAPKASANPAPTAPATPADAPAPIPKAAA